MTAKRCPECGSTLHIEDQSAELVTCEFCGSVSSVRGVDVVPMEQEAKPAQPSSQAKRHPSLCAVIELQTQDDLASIRHRLDQVEGERVALVVPWDMQFLSRRVDFDLLRREADRRQLEVAIVSTDFERRGLAYRCGVPAFARVSEAESTRKWRARSLEPAEAPPRHWWDVEVDLRPRPRSRLLRFLPPWFNWIKLGVRLVIFLLALLVVVVSAYVIVPSGSVTLVPASREFVTIVPVSTDVEIEEVDHVAGLIPARKVGDYFEGSIEVETTGIMNLVTGRATGEVEFTNLLAQDYVVPKGTIVRTSSTSYPIRFRTTADVVVPAAGRVLAPIEALEDGVGNVGAFQINVVESVAASAVAVINPQATSGAEPREARVVTQADYDRGQVLLMQQLLGQAYDGLSGNYLEPSEILLRQSLRIEAMPKLAYDRFVTEQADKVGVNMRILVSGWAVDVDNAEAVAYVALSRRIPSGYRLMDARFEMGEAAEEDIGPGDFTFFVTAYGEADAMLNPGEAVSLVRGQRLDDARNRLVANLPLAKEPQITHWPDWPKELKWLERMPLLSLRIDVKVESPTETAAQAR
ncbi:MAG: baseplate J/gp47 family protein [Anaerolineae bacterium]|nr:baseplate J/gp47 family protein [Anaerolineae bacterium]